jgi:hypothetical protein
MGVTAALGVALLAATLGSASAQDKSLKQQIVGTWRLAATDDPAGAGAQGIAMFDGSGNFALQIAGAKTAAGNAAYYGTYSVNDADRSLTFHVDLSSVAAWNRSDQKEKIVSVTADELKWTGPMPSGTTGSLTWRHALSATLFNTRGVR